MAHTPSAISIRKLLPLAALALISFWFANRDDNASTSQPGIGFTKDVDYYLKGVTTKSFDADGELRYQLDAKLAQHYRSKDAVELTQPQMHYRIGDTTAKPSNDESNFWRIAARQGWFYEEQPPRLARLELSNNVVITRQDSNSQAITTRTEEMWFLPGTGELHSQTPVTIQQGQHVLNAQRLSINTQNDRIKLRGGVKGVYYPSSARKGS